jgi:putative membrane protein
MVACAGTVLGGISLAQANETYGAGAAPTSASFVRKAGEGGLAEVEASKLAASKAQSPQVREFAEQMVKDHSKANTELKSVAKQKSLEVPASVNAEHKAALEKLKATPDAEFDTAYMELMKKDHDKTVALFTSASTASGVDKDLQGFAKKALPTLEHHQHMATELNTKTASVSPSSASKTR